MIKISISGEATEDQRKAFDTALFEAVSSYLGQFPTGAVKTNWRKERNKSVTVDPTTTEVVVAVADSMQDAQTATPATEVK